MPKTQNRPDSTKIRRFGETRERLCPNGEWVTSSEETSLMREKGETEDSFKIRVKRWANLCLITQLPDVSRDSLTCDVVYHWADGDIVRARIVILPRIDISTVVVKIEE